MSQNERQGDPEDIASRADELLQALDQPTPLPPSPSMETSQSGVSAGRSNKRPNTPPGRESSVSHFPATASSRSGIPRSFLLGSLTAFVVMVIGLASINLTETRIRGSSPQGMNPAPKAEQHLDSSEPAVPVVVDPRISEMSPPEQQLQPKDNSGSMSSDSSLSESGWEPCTFRSYRDSSTKTLSCQASVSTNTNGHTVYNVRWSDGYTSSYVFWSSGNVEIFSKDGQGKPDREAGQFTSNSEGVEMTSSLGSVTFLAGLDPDVN